MSDARRTAVAAMPWLVAAGGFAIDVWAYWPGFMSFDSAYAWWQARGGATDDIASPAMVLVWRLGNAIIEGPASMFSLHAAMFWIGLAWFARALRVGPAASLAVMLIGFAPPIWLLRAHVWTDVGFLSALMLASALMFDAHSNGRRGEALLALPLLLYALALRHNAGPALLPLTLAWTLIVVGAPMARARARIAATWIAVCTGLALATAAIGARVDRHEPVWTSLAQFDLAALSIASGRMLLPDFMIGPGLEVSELADAFRPWSNLAMYASTRHGMRAPFGRDFSSEQLAELRRRWIGAIADEPLAWMRHRARVARALIGAHDASWPRELVYVDDEVRYGDNPPVVRNASTAHRALMRAAGFWVATPLLAAWPSLLAGPIAFALAWRRRAKRAAIAAFVLLASAWLYLATLLALAPAAELRYLGWPMLASLIALALALRSRSADAAD